RHRRDTATIGGSSTSHGGSSACSCGSAWPPRWRCRPPIWLRDSLQHPRGLGSRTRPVRQLSWGIDGIVGLSSAERCTYVVRVAVEARVVIASSRLSSSTDLWPLIVDTSDGTKILNPLDIRQNCRRRASSILLHSVRTQASIGKCRLSGVHSARR